MRQLSEEEYKIELKRIDEALKAKGRNVDDGLLDRPTWIAESPKILFLLKETNNGFTDIRKPPSIHSGNSKVFWWNLCYWKHAIKTGVNLQDASSNLPQKNELEEEALNGGLLKAVAYVNVKKQYVADKNRSDNRDLDNFARIDKEELKAQVELCAPDVIVCCGIRLQFERYKLIHSGPSLVSLTDHCHKHEERLVIDFWHPACRKSPPETYELLHREIMSVKRGGHFRWACEQSTASGFDQPDVGVRQS